MHRLDWQLVRHLSRLSILNRLAFTMLVMVPLIAAALWVPMQKTADGYNGLVTNAREKIGIETGQDQDEEVGDDPAGNEGESSNLDAEAAAGGDESDASSIRTALEDIGAGIGARPLWQALLPSVFQDLMLRFFPQAVDKPVLPNAWALAFFAALFILFGDTLVQLFCPTIVREFGREEYVCLQKNTFANAPSRITLQRAIDRLREVDNAHAMATDEIAWQTSNEGARNAISQELTRLLSSVLETREGTLDSNLPNGKQELLLQRLQVLQQEASPENTQLNLRRIGLIEHASRQEYLELAHHRKLWAFLSFAAYLVAGSIIVKILYDQSFHVIRAAGWIDQ